MKKILFIAVLMMLVSSCAPLNITEFRPYPTNDKLLPALTPRIDIESFENVYSMEYRYPVVADRYYAAADAKANAIDIGVNDSTEWNGKDSRIQDAIIIFKRDVQDNITVPYGEKKGTILCKIPVGNAKKGGIGWVILSGCTLCIPNLFGMPFGYYKTLLDVEVEIYDVADNLIGKYNAQCYDITWISLYHGYYASRIDGQASPASRKSNIDAFKCAMNEIKSQIVKDADRLNGLLNK